MAVNGKGNWSTGFPELDAAINQVQEQQAAKQQTNVPFGQSPYYDPNAFNFGGAPGLAQQWAGFGMGQAAKQNAADDMYTGQSQQAMQWGQQSRGEQQGAVDLARDAAMGRAPSQAALLMQQGLNNAAAQQNSQAASARGSAALANAQSNAGANIAALQNQTFNEAGQLRANEMAQARGLYGNLSSGMRQQDNSYAGMLGGLGIDRAKLGQGYYGQAAGIVGQQGDAQRAGQGLLANDWNAQRQNDEGHYQYETNRKDAAYNQQAAAVGDAINAGGQVAGALGKGTGMGGTLPSGDGWDGYTGANATYAKPNYGAPVGSQQWASDVNSQPYPDYKP